MTKTESPVLVVGGRTTGLTMACELVRHGVPARIIDKSPSGS
jgi:2-polyprenyl-6-methoxyphenol hydroxylase-like FAD-dependent oxidoreductase